MINRMELPSFSTTFKRIPFQPNKGRKRHKKGHKGKKSKKQNKYNILTLFLRSRSHIPYIYKQYTHRQIKPGPLPIIEPIDSEQRYQEQQQEALEIVDVASSFDEDGYHYENFEEVDFQYLPTLKQTDMSSFCLSVSSKSINGFEEELLFEHHGYVKESDPICNTLQGQLLKCKATKMKQQQQMDGIKGDESTTSTTTTTEQYVAIKRISKELHRRKIIANTATTTTTDDDDDTFDGVTFCTEEDVVKEAQILQYLTDHKSTEYIAKYIDFFESATDYYLVHEYIEGESNLLQFVQTAHSYIAAGRLDVKVYQKTIKYIMWQLCAVVHWLHNNMHCLVYMYTHFTSLILPKCTCTKGCHLNLNLENIMLENAVFIQNTNGSIGITSDISAKLCDFGVAEVFAGKHDNFQCVKLGSTTGAIQYQSPKMVAEEPYDARKADVWSLGMILFECVFGEPLYTKVGGCDGSGYWAAMHNKLSKYILSSFSNAKCVNAKLLVLLSGMLNCDEAERLNSYQILQSRWFKSYFKRYQGKFEKNAREKRKSLQRNKSKLLNRNDFKFYAY